MSQWETPREIKIFMWIVVPAVLFVTIGIVAISAVSIHTGIVTGATSVDSGGFSGTEFIFQINNKDTVNCYSSGGILGGGMSNEAIINASNIHVGDRVYIIGLCTILRVIK